MDNQTHETIYLNIYGNITSKSVQQIIDICTQLLGAHKPKQFYFCLSSNGGEVNAGFTLYNFLASLPVEVVMHNIGTVDSIATVIFLAGTKRYAAQHSTFLYHGVQFNVGAPTAITYSKLKEHLSAVEADENRIARVIDEKTDLSFEEVKELQGQGKTLTPLEAKDKGIVHEVMDVNIPHNAAMVNISM